MSRRLLLMLAVVVALALPSGVIGFVQYRAVQQSDAAVQQTTRLRDLTVQACADRTRQYEALYRVIIEQNKPQRPSQVILDALPEFKPFFTPGNPLYDEQLRDAHARRDRMLAVLGTRPDC